MAHFQISVSDIVARRNAITQKIAGKERTERFYYYIPEGIDLPVIRVDIGLPVYRLANYRTRTRQKAYIHKNGLGEAFFSTGEENDTPQRAQHDLLVDLASQGKGESIIPILRKLEEDRRQTETLLVTEAGVVVNGNRRLAAMRELFAQDSATYASFGQIQVAVLPATIMGSDLKKIEVQLQMQQETKLPYDWTAQCLAVRELATNGVQKQEIMLLMRLRKESEVQALIDQLNEAEIYITDYLKNPDDFTAIEDQEQQFIELQKALDRKQDIGEKELARKMCYVLTKHSQELGSRAYDFRIAFGAKTKEVAERLAERLNVTLSPAPPPPVNGDGVEDIFGGDESSSTTARFAPLKTVLADQNTSKEIAIEIREICNEIKEEEDDKDIAHRALKEVKKARGVLERIDLDKAGKATYEDIRAQLDQVAGTVEAMKTKLDSMA